MKALHRQVSSIHNPLLQAVRRALRDGLLLDDRILVAEGPHLLDEARRSNCSIPTVIVTPQARERHAGLLAEFDRGPQETELVEVPEPVLRKTAATETTQGIIFLVEMPARRWTELAGTAALVTVLDGVQDPGNAGTLIRSAEAFGGSGVVLTEESVRLANSKLSRATAGSIFRVPCLDRVSRAELVGWLRQDAMRAYRLEGGAPTAITRARWDEPCALIIGSEGHGASPVLRAISEPLSIPTRSVESLNAAVAGSIALFEAARRRGIV